MSAGELGAALEPSSLSDAEINARLASYVASNRQRNPITETIVNNIHHFARHCKIDLFALKHRFVTPISPYSPDLISKVDESNQKNPNAPLAVIITVGSDTNGSLSSPYAQDFILQIAKTHRVLLQTLYTGYMLGPQVKKTIEEHQEEEIPLFCIFAHGASDKMIVGKELFDEREIWDSGPFIRVEDLDPNDFSLLAKNARFILRACSTGSDENGLASYMSRIIDRPVQAATQIVQSPRAIYTESDDHKPRFLCYDDLGQPITREFFPDGTSEIISVPKEEEKKLLAERVESIKQLAKGGNGSSQITLAELYLLGLGVEKNTELAMHWYSRAAEQGSVLAQHNLALLKKNPAPTEVTFVF